MQRSRSLLLRSAVLVLVLALSALAAESSPSPAPLPTTIDEIVAPYPLERHVANTEDGYVLTLFRIPHGLEKETSSQNGTAKPVVLLQHGLLDSCAGFLLHGPQALAFMLADAGFDVWLANSRGSTHSRRHAWLSVLQAQFWAFTFDEMAKYDLPANLATVLQITGAPRVSYVSHSQGGTIMLAALASQPRLAQHLGLAVLMAPVAAAKHMKSVPMLALATLNTDAVFAVLGVHEFMPSNPQVAWMEGQLCLAQPDLCVSILTAISGYRRGAVNTTRLPLYLAFTPAGTSVQNVEHWVRDLDALCSDG